MRRRPPRLKRTDTLLPYTTLVRSGEPQMTMPTNLRRNASAIALGLALTAWLPAAAMAQDADTAPVEAAPAEGEIIVTGIRGAINNSVQAKKANTSIVRSEEHTSELQSLMRISYAVFCLKKKKTNNKHNTQPKSK